MNYLIHLIQINFYNMPSLRIPAIIYLSRNIIFYFIILIAKNVDCIHHYMFLNCIL